MCTPKNVLVKEDTSNASRRYEKFATIPLAHSHGGFEYLKILQILIFANGVYLCIGFCFDIIADLCTHAARLLASGAH